MATNKRHPKIFLDCPEATKNNGKSPNLNNKNGMLKKLLKNGIKG